MLNVNFPSGLCVCVCVRCVSLFVPAPRMFAICRVVLCVRPIKALTKKGNEKDVHLKKNRAME